MELRPYQIKAVEAVQKEWKEGRKRTLLVIPTGGGKTIIFSELTRRESVKGRVLILAHRDELIRQAADKLYRSTGIFCGIEKGVESSGGMFDVCVASVQTLSRPNRLEKYPPDYFRAVIVDEAHHCLAESYRRILEHFSPALVLGVTATPDRGDKKTLAEVFDSIAFEYSLSQAIKDGYLVPPKAEMIPINIDLSKVKTSMGDYTDGSLGEALGPYLEKIADEMVNRCMNRKTVIFLPLIATSQAFCEMLKRRGFQATEVNGMSKDRKEKLKGFEDGTYNCLCNSMLLCLDNETEILTSRGFLGMNDLTMDDEVANWNFDGTVFFEKPKDIVVRDLEPTEHMVSVATGRHNFRVTNTHRMIVGSGVGHRAWKKKAADELNRRDVLPACGVAEPMQMQVQQEDRSQTKHAINNCVYHLTQKGWDREEARKEAARRAEHDATLRYKNPEELTTEECKFIGFWIADGAKTNLQSGGTEYSLAQSERYGNICKWVDEVVESCGFDYIKRRIRPDKKSSFHSLKWSLPRGTGKGCQQKNGVYSIEPYLNKDGSCYFWGLNEKQFDALLEGFWYGDGFHGDAQDGMPSNITMTNTNHGLLELFCSIGAVRGWKCSMSFIKIKNEKHRDQYRLNMTKYGKIVLSEKTQINHEAFSPETVWCVRTTSKNIITRRHGRVTVMGNTEGWDCPSADCIVVLRPTKIRALYSQMVGRVLRLSPETGKKDALILDFLWMTTKHDLVKPAALVAKDSKIAERMEKMLEEGEALDLVDIEAQAVKEEAQAGRDAILERERNLARQLSEQKAKQRKLVDPIYYGLMLDDDFITEYEPTFPWELEEPTEKQLSALEKCGIRTEAVKTKGLACKLLDLISKRIDLSLATPKQMKILTRFGFKNAGSWTKDEASSMITRLANCGWQVPRGITPATYQPSEQTEVFNWEDFNG